MNNQMETFKHQESFEHLMTGEDLLEEALDKRQRAHELTVEILATMDELNTLLQRPCPISGTTDVSLAREIWAVTQGYGDDMASRKGSIDKKIDSHFWTSIISNSSITAVMHSEMKAKFNKKIDEEPPEFTREAVYGTLTHYMDNRFVIFVEGALNLFKTLNKDFKTNDGIRIRDKIIFGSAMGTYGWCMYGRARDLSEDLERIFYVLDGIDPTRRPYSEWATTRMEKMDRPSEQQFEYFKVRSFKNGNVHLWLTRPDLVEKLNQMLTDHYGDSLGHRNSVRN